MLCVAAECGWSPPAWADDTIERSLPVTAEVVAAEVLDATDADPGTLLSISGTETDLLLDLRPSRVVGPDTRITHVTARRVYSESVRTRHLHGNVRGDADSLAVISLGERGTTGLVRRAGSDTIIEPYERYGRALAPGLSIAYRAADIEPETIESACATEHAPRARRRTAAAAQRSASPDPDAEVIVEMAAVADYELFERYGAATADHVLSLLSAVDALYLEDLGVQLRVREVLVFETAADPFQQSNPGARLAELGDVRANSAGFPATADLLHLFTGASLDSGTAGMAYVGSVCGSRNATGLSAEQSSFDRTLRVAAHELAHNLGAFHDGQPGSECSDAPQGYVMWPYLSSSSDLAFSPCSRDMIVDSLAAAECVTHGVSPLCGNGVLDPGEHCDDGNVSDDDCCSALCELDPVGAACDGDDDECTDNVCDGAGVCVASYNEAPCSDGDACTVDGLCAEGVCVPSEELRELSSVKFAAKLKPGNGDDKIKLKARWPLASAMASPAYDGLTVELLHADGTLLDTIQLPAVGFESKIRRSAKYSFPRDSRSACGARWCAKAGVKVKGDADSVSLKITAVAPDVEPTLLTATMTVRVRFGTGGDAECATMTDLPCTVGTSSVQCQGS